MDFINDDSMHAAQDFPTAFGGDHQVERFGGRDQQLRRALQHRCPLTRGRVATAHADANVRRGASHLFGDLGDLGEGLVEVLLDVDTKRLQRRYVDDLRSLGRLFSQSKLFRLAIQAIDTDHERRKRLARPGRRRDQRVYIVRDRGPPLDLGFRRSFRKLALEPGSDCRMKGFEDRVGCGHRHGSSEVSSAIRRRKSVRACC